MISVRISHLHTLFRCVLNDVTMLNGGIGGKMVLDIDAEVAIYILMKDIYKDMSEIENALGSSKETGKMDHLNCVVSDLVFRVGDLELAWEEYKASCLD